ncbi:MAG TPA: RES family NAD+ phosphorylase [Steroidobacteraceae bacterium]|nr:RES family NAD+ phosphorylase [Steroidobacteraceae bacterium]
MSSSTWTPHAVAFERKTCELTLWRAVEAQHVVATRALVDSLAEQEVLESVLEASKPRVPRECVGLDYLLYTPFRYPPPPHGSRFRRYGEPGVWYGAEAVRTTCAEVGYWRWRFVMDSHGLTRLDGVAHTVFQALARGEAVDLRSEPFVRDATLWSNPQDYGACQGMARAARAGEIQIIRYASVRDPEHGGCGAVLDCRTFAGTGGIRQRQSWFLSVDRQRASWVRSGTRNATTYEFLFQANTIQSRK